MLRECRWQLALLLGLTTAISLLAGIPAFLSRAIVDRAIPHYDGGLMSTLVVALMLNAIGYAATNYAQGLVNVRLSQNLTVALRRRLTAAIYNAPLSSLKSTAVGDLVTRVSNDVDALDGIWSGPVVTMYANLSLVVITLGYVFLISPPLAGLALVLIPVSAIAVNRIGRSIYEVRAENRRVRDRFNTVIVETFSPLGLAFVKAYGLERSEQRRIERLTDELRSSELRGAGIGLSFGVFSSWATMSTPPLVWFVGFYLVQAHALTLGGLVAVVALILRLYSPATALAAMQLQLSSAAATFDRIVQYLQLPREAPGGPFHPDTERVRGPSVAFEAVAFRYPSGTRDVLHDLSLRIDAGEFVAITGPSGAGKTSLVQLLIRFYEISGGRITVDDADLHSLDVRSLREQIGYVAQDPFFLNDTVRNNLQLAAPDSTAAEIERACVLARADFVDSLPGGLDAPLGDRGVNLSGGQRQRLALARAFLRKPRLLILDEATNALDGDTESAILGMLDAALPGSTKLLVTHRASALRFAERVVAIRDGRVLETLETAV